LSNGTLFSKQLVQKNNAPKRAQKWASAVNKMGTGQRPIIRQVVALCRPRPDSWSVTARVCRKWPCIN